MLHYNYYNCIIYYFYYLICIFTIFIALVIIIISYICVFPEFRGCQQSRRRGRTKGGGGATRYSYPIITTLPLYLPP